MPQYKLVLKFFKAEGNEEQDGHFVKQIEHKQKRILMQQENMQKVVLLITQVLPWCMVQNQIQKQS
jgi:hypothetical protein